MDLSIGCRRRLALLLTALALSGCDSTGPGLPEASFTATWAGQPWRGDARATFGPTADTLYLIGASPVGAGSSLETYVLIRVPFQGPGTYTLGPGGARFVYLVGGDVRTAEYQTTDIHTGTLVIEESPESRLRGEVAFEAVSVFEHSPAGSEARFQGRFDAEIF